MVRRGELEKVGDLRADLMSLLGQDGVDLAMEAVPNEIGSA